MTEIEQKELLQKANELLKSGQAEHGIEILAQSLGPAHPYIAIGYNAFGAQQSNKEDWAGAKMAFEQALVIWQYCEDKPSLEISACMYNLGRVYSQLGDLDKAITMHREALQQRLELLDSDHPDTGLSYLGLGAVLLANGDTDAATTLFESGIALYERAEMIDSKEMAACKANLILCRQTTSSH